MNATFDKLTLFFWPVAALTGKEGYLNRVQFFIFANVSAADVILLSGMCMGLLQALLRNDLNNLYINAIVTAIMIANLSSLFTTSLLAGNRFLAVKYSLEYNSKR